MDKPPDQNNPATEPPCADSSAGRHDSIIAGLEQRTCSSIRIQLIPSGDDATPVIKVGGNGGTTFNERPELCVGEKRYRAACAAVMAGTGKGRNPARERAR